MAHISIPDEDIVATFDVTDAEDTFPVSFALFNKRDLGVTVNGVELDLSQFSFTGTLLPGGGYQGGSVVLNTEAEDERVVIWRKVPRQRSNNFTPSQSVPIRDLDTALDCLQAQLQDAGRDHLMTIRVPPGEVGSVLPPASERASRFLAFNSTGGAVTVPAIADPIVIAEMDQASVYFDRNPDMAPRLMLDVNGMGLGEDSGLGGPGVFANSTVVLRDVVPLENEGSQRVFIGVRFSDDPGPAFDGFNNRRSRFAVGILAKSEIGIKPDKDNDPAHPEDDVFYAQEAGGLQIVATAATGTDRAKVEGIVVSAREESGLIRGSKGVAVQAITVRTTAGPSPDDRSILSDNEDGEGDAEPATEVAAGDAANFGSVTIRLNAGTVKVADESGNLQPVFGGWRSYAAMMASGRAGYFNGIVLKKLHTNLPEGATDPEDVGGWGGVAGGRGFWHENMFATYCKEGMEGWVCIGHDGIPLDSDGTNSLARAPLDIEVDVGVTNIMTVNGDKLLTTRRTGWVTPTGTSARDAWSPDTVAALTFSATPTQAECNALRDACQTAFRRIRALQVDLENHGLIGPTP